MANTPLRHVRIDDEMWQKLGETLQADETKSDVIRQLIAQRVDAYARTK